MREVSLTIPDEHQELFWRRAYGAAEVSLNDIECEFGAFREANRPAVLDPDVREARLADLQQAVQTLDRELAIVAQDGDRATGPADVLAYICEKVALTSAEDLAGIAATSPLDAAQRELIGRVLARIEWSADNAARLYAEAVETRASEREAVAA